jgi:hypothetical protein
LLVGVQLINSDVSGAQVVHAVQTRLPMVVEQMLLSYVPSPHSEHGAQTRFVVGVHVTVG